MNVLPLRQVLLALVGAGTVLVLVGVVADLWQLAVLGVAALQGAVVVALVRARAARPVGAPEEVRLALLRLEERLQAVDQRVVLESSATQQLLEKLRARS